MKALSIQQPFAHAILHLGKDVENRTWPWPASIPLPCRIVIHAGKREDTEGHEIIKQMTSVDVPWDLPKGCLVGEATVLGSFNLAEARAETGRPKYNPWVFGPYCWVLTDPIAYPEPIPYRGQLRIFEVEVSDGSLHRV